MTPLRSVAEAFGDVQDLDILGEIGLTGTVSGPPWQWTAEPAAKDLAASGALPSNMTDDQVEWRTERGIHRVGPKLPGWVSLADDGELPGVGASPFPRLHRDLDRASDFAPAGVLLDHTHEQGDWTFFYRYQREDADQLKQGEATVTPDAYQALYPGEPTPVSQLDQTHTFGVMYAPHPRFTLGLMLPLVEKRLDKALPGGGFERQQTSGIGDAKAMVLLPFMQKGSQKTQFNILISLPTGSIRAEGSDGSRLPYSMQHGTGTWDILWGLTYTGKEQGLSWGAQVESQYRMNTNDLGYELSLIHI